MLSIVKGPYLQMPGCNEITVSWETSVEASSRVLVYPMGLTDDQRRKTFMIQKPCVFEDASAVCIHRVKVSGLEPGTSYYYRVSSVCGENEVESPVGTLAAAAGPGRPFSFAVTAETGNADTAVTRAIFEQIRTCRPDFLLTLGDIVYNGTDYEHWSRFFFSPAADVLVNTPHYGCIGNSESELTWESGPTWFFEFCNSSTPGNYYSFDYGDAHFVCLDSSELVDADNPADEKMHPGEAQYDFLVRDLREAEAKWKVVFFHYPPYASADFEIPAMRALCPVFEECGVDVVFTSHTLVYERSHPITRGRLDEKNGVRYVVCGGAGASKTYFDWFRPKREWHTAQAFSTPHFIQVVVTPQTFELMAIDDQGRQFDRTTIRK